MSKTKKYDAVEEVRKFRDKMGPIYMKDPERLKQDLKKARDEFFPEDWGKDWIKNELREPGDAIDCEAPAH
ncbi:hypothetical protein [Chitinophaga caseinilytica]|uniref:hypothetical protein n=1 Tax=Chitinophaga caseinilytica TaxID=2267521 RepID=UPI003C2BBFDF